jgi:hypothetical protein
MIPRAPLLIPGLGGWGSRLLAALTGLAFACLASAHAQTPTSPTNTSALAQSPEAIVPAPLVALPPIQLDDVLRSVTNQYPPLLAAYIERDIANGRLRSAQGVFDFNVFAKSFGNPSGYYDYGTFDAGFEQFLGVWGSTLFGGYRITRGTLPDYDKNLSLIHI